MLELTKKACKLGKSFSANTEHHGDDDVGAVDMRFDGIMLAAKEIDALLGNEAHKALFVYPPPRQRESTMPQVRFPFVAPLVLDMKFENATVTMHLGTAPAKLKFVDCKISRISLEPTEGGLTKMKCSVRARPESDAVGTLFDCRDTTGVIWISKAEKVEPNKNQGQLGLGDPDGDEEEESGEE